MRVGRVIVAEVRELYRRVVDDFGVRLAGVQPGQWDAGTQTFETLVGRLLCADTLVHTWDLARATAQDEHLDAEAGTKALEFLRSVGEAIRGPGGFGPEITPSPGADTQTVLLNFGGRAI